MICDTINSATGAAVSIGDEYVVVMSMLLGKRNLEPVSYPLRTVVQRGIQTLYVDCRPLIGLKLFRKGAATND